MIFGTPLDVVVLFVVLGVLIGVVFGFFGMGGSFLVTPTLLVMGYPAKTAVGSSLAFVFGTSIIAALRHNDAGKVDFKLGSLFVVGMTAGIEVGKRLMFYLDSLGLADTAVSVAYIVVLTSVGGMTLYRGKNSEGDTEEGAETRVGAIVQSIDVPPQISVSGGGVVSIWVVLLAAVAIGVMSGFLGIGGGFLLLPTMMYGLGVPAAVAIGTDVFQIALSTGAGAFLYAQSGVVEMGIVVPLLAGSALGARVGAGATKLVDSDSITSYFGALLLGGAVAIAVRKVGNVVGSEVLEVAGVVLLLGSAFVVVCVIAVSAIRTVLAE